MQGSEAIDSAARGLQLTDYERSSNNSGQVRWENNVGWYTVDAVRAGWLEKDNGKWSLTPEGVEALKLPPGEFMTKAHEAYVGWQKHRSRPKPEANPGASDIEELQAVLEGRDGTAWWVNQGDSYTEERDGGYIWAPKQSSSGVPLEHYTALNRLRAGDAILHYANTALRAASRVVQPATEADRPGSSKDKDGLLARVEYHEFTAPIALDFIPLSLRSADAGPFTRVGTVKQGYLFGLSDAFVSGLLDQLSLPTAAGRPVTLRGLLKDEDLASLVLPAGTIAGAIAALDAGNHLILTGPPGTGKTKLAELLAKAAARYRYTVSHILTTASADWTTFDTIGGYMPDPDDPSRLRFERGIVLEAIASDRWLILDEINRADADKAFGALLTLLSGFDTELAFRNTDGSRFKLRRSNELKSYFDDATSAFYVGKNWRIIATMNTRDKNSLYALSYAFMRRFSFVLVSPPSEAVVTDIVHSAVQVTEASDLAMKIFRASRVPLGPAIAIDIARLIASHSKPLEGVRNSVIAYLLPQLEGRESPFIRKTLHDLRISLNLDRSIETDWLDAAGVLVGVTSEDEATVAGQELPAVDLDQ